MKSADARADSFTAFFKTATGGFVPYRWQSQLAVQGLPEVLPVPTGLGKTEVALAWAWRLLVDEKTQQLGHWHSVASRVLSTNGRFATKCVRESRQAPISWQPVQVSHVIHRVRLARPSTVRVVRWLVRGSGCELGRDARNEGALWQIS
jgi:hypothetical protein